MSQSTLLSLPYQLLIDNILYHLDTVSLLNLRQASKSCQQLADDEIVWRRRIAQDFNFPIFNSARISGWQRLYKGLANPELYTWGEWSNDRIGRRLGPRDLPPHLWNLFARIRGVPFPLQIDWKKAKICCDVKEEENEEEGNAADDQRVIIDDVKTKESTEGFMGIPIQIYAGGWCFYALTDKGQILAWGESYEHWEIKTCFSTPVMLNLHDRRARSLSVGRAHAVAIMDDDGIWEWSKLWQRSISLDRGALFGKVSEDSVKVMQIEAGWDLTACLAIVKEDYEDKSVEDSMANQSTRIAFWKTDQSYLQSNSNRGGSYPEKHMLSGIVLPRLESPVVKIAAGDNFILALTEDHAVYCCTFPALPDGFDLEYRGILTSVPSRWGNDPEQDRLRDAYVRKIQTFYQNILNRGQMNWKLLKSFSTDLRLSGAQKDGLNIWDRPELAHLVKIDTKITHISAQFTQFAVYAPEAGKDSKKSTSRGIVILGKHSNFEESIVMPQLQGQQVIKVSQGDWHSGALTLDGRVLTWGEQSKGALGSWDSLPIPDNAISTLEPVRRPPPQRTGIFRFFNGQPAPGDTNTEYALKPEEIADLVNAEKARYHIRDLPQRIVEPLPVKFGFPKIGEQRQGELSVSAEDNYETKYVFDIAFAGWHSGALAIDRNLISERSIIS